MLDDPVLAAPVLAGTPVERRAGFQLAGGISLLLLAMLLLATAKVAGTVERHAYDPHADPPSLFRLTAGRTYELSAGETVAALARAGLLATVACTWSQDEQVEYPLVLSAVLTDPGNLHQFALFRAPVTGELQLRCAGIGPVFVDDADDSGTDYGAVALMLAVVVGLCGALALVCGGYQLLAGPIAVTAARSSRPAVARPVRHPQRR